MVEAVCAAIAGVCVLVTSLRGGGRVPVAWMERVETKLDDLIDWQVEHEREHVAALHRRKGGMQ